MLEFFLIAQCSLTLPDGSLQSFEFCGTTRTVQPNTPYQENVKPSQNYEPNEPSQESNIPDYYRYLTQDNYHYWEALVKDYNPMNSSSPASLSTAQSLFGSGKVIQTKGKEMQKVRWEESDRSIDAWFKRRGNTWILMRWSARGFN